MLLVFVAVSPVIGERIHGLHQLAEERMQAAGFSALDLARQAADVQDDLLTSAKTMLKAVSLTDQAKRPASEGCSEFAEQVQQSVAWMNTLSIANPAGEILCASSPDSLGLNISDRPHFRQAVESRELAVSDYLVSKSGNKPIIALASPRLNKAGKIDAIVLATIELKSLDRLIGAISSRLNVSAFLVDSTGTLLAQFPRGLNGAPGQYRDHPLIRAILDRPYGTVAREGLGGERKVFGFVTLGASDARMVVGLSEVDVLTPIDEQLHQWYLGLLILMAAILLGVWWGGERFVVRPIAEFAARAVQVGMGHYEGAQSRPTSLLPSEFAPLDHALGRMARTLALREQELQKSNKHLGRLAQTDSLTGLGNRRRFDTKFSKIASKCAADDVPLSVLLLDVDLFKQFNDRYGHPAGDACLQAIANEIRSICPRPAAAARYGGEEFVILLPNVDQRGASQRAERLRAAIAALGMSHQQSPYSVVTVTIGLACSTGVNRLSAEELIHAADAALYAGKQEGRNCVSPAQTSELALAS
jgi:diguanylate cyclase (GGDEF)-like protein